jgi:hypothetical protein
MFNLLSGMLYFEQFHVTWLQFSVQISNVVVVQHGS